MLYLLESSLLSLMLFFIWRMNSHFAAAKCHKTDRKRHEMHKIRGFGGGHVKLCSAGRSDTVHRRMHILKQDHPYCSCLGGTAEM